MERACRMQGSLQKSIQNLARGTEFKVYLGRPRHNGRVILIWTFNNVWVCCLDQSGLGMNELRVFVEHTLDFSK